MLLVIKLTMNQTTPTMNRTTIIILLIIVLALFGLYHLISKPTTPTTSRTTTPEIESIQKKKGDLNQSIKDHYNDTIGIDKGNRNDTLINNINTKWNE